MDVVCAFGVVFIFLTALAIVQLIIYAILEMIINILERKK